jgi:type IV pilus assembly protein PilY1
MRRGGKNYYGLDVTDPERPRLMWTIEKGGDFAELGYTFSNPRVGLVETASGPRPALMFAGGYDLNKDTRGVVGTDDSEGNAIFVVDAETGALIWKARRGSGGAGSQVFEHAGMKDSIPSALTVGDTDGDGFIDRIVVGDSRWITEHLYGSPILPSSGSRAEQGPVRALRRCCYWLR